MASVFAREPRATRFVLNAIYVRDHIKSFVYLGIGFVAAFFFLAGFSFVVVLTVFCFVAALVYASMLESKLLAAVQKSPLYTWARSPEGLTVIAVVVSTLAAVGYILLRYHSHHHAMYH